MRNSISTAGELVSRKPRMEIESWATVAEALALMDTKGLHATGVTHKGILAGLFTYQDGVRRVLAQGLNPLKTCLGNVMTTDPVTIRPDCALRQAFEILCRKPISHLPVVENGRLLGILSDEDLRGAIANDLQELSKENNLLLSYIYGEPYALCAVC